MNLLLSLCFVSLILLDSCWASDSDTTSETEKKLIYQLQFKGDLDHEMIDMNAKHKYMNRENYGTHNPPAIVKEAIDYITSEFLAVIHPPNERRLTDDLDVISGKCEFGEKDFSDSSERQKSVCQIAKYVIVDENKKWFSIDVTFDQWNRPEIKDREKELLPDMHDFVPLGIGITANINLTIILNPSLTKVTRRNRERVTLGAEELANEWLKEASDLMKRILKCDNPESVEIVTLEEFSPPELSGMVPKVEKKETVPETPASDKDSEQCENDSCVDLDKTDEPSTETSQHDEL